MIHTLIFAISAYAANVHLIEVKGSINPGSANYIVSSLESAQSSKADLFILRLDTPGGLLSSMEEVVQHFDESSIPVAVWVSPAGGSATSAGAIIALSSHLIVMAPGTSIGAAHPVSSSGEDIKGTMGEKITSHTAALARSQAILRQRKPELAEQLVTKSRSFSAKEAVEAGLADYVADDLKSLLAQANSRVVKVAKPLRELKLSFPADSASPQVTQTPMTVKQKFLHFISDPNVSTMLLTVGGLALWAEISSGFGSIAAGVVGAFCFLLGFISLQTLPVTTGGMLLLLLGFVLLVLEAFVTSYGLLSIGALTCLFLGGLFLIDPGSGSMRVSLSLLISMVAGVGSILLVVGAMLYRDRHRYARSSNALVGLKARVASVENSGTSGTAEVNGELWGFVAAHPLEAGELAKIHSIHGLKLKLEKDGKHGTH